MKHLIKISAIAASLLLLAVSCKEETEALAPNTFEISSEYTTIALEQFRQVAFVPVKTNISESEWDLSSSASWCQVGKSVTNEKGIMIAVDDNTDRESERTATVTAKAGGKEYKLKVIQTGYGPAIIVSDVTIGPEGGVVSLSVISNVEIDEEIVKAPVFNTEDNGEDGLPWITYVPSSATKAFATLTYTFNVETNELPDSRTATVTLKAKNSEDAAASTTCRIVQSSIDASDTQVFIDNKVNVLSVRANQFSQNETAYGNGPAELMIDGGYDTYYHSPWPAEGEGTVFPVVWEFEFYGDQRIDYINIMHRGTTSGYGTHSRGQIGEFNLYYKVNPSDEYTFVKKFDFGGNGGYQTANLDQSIENATWIKIEVLNGDPNAASRSENPYITCAEVEFFNSNRAEVNEWLDKIFTDRSCMELREDVTRKDIIKMNAVAPYIATNVAMPLFNGTYDENEYDFRAHSYEPYSDNKVNRALVTRLYSAMDNPTGIEVKQGDDIIVCVDQIPSGQTVSLAVYGEADEYGPNYGGGGDNESYGQNTVLVAGINNIRITANGMAYVMNTIQQADPRHPDTTPVSEYKNVKVHILPGRGKVQGYYDPKRHSEDRYKELLNKCTYKYFMVKGEKVLFLFHTNQLRSDWPNSILSGITVWDDIVKWQHSLMGIDKKTWFNNHIAAVTSSNPDVYMNASHRRVQFGVKTIANIGSREKMLEGTGQGSIWGPAHEMGHVNQQAINWRSTTESSNNLFSNFAVYNVAGDKYYDRYWSRGKKIADLANDYAQKVPWALLGDGSYQNEDPELHMRLNWQLWNYFHNCGYNTEFFPTLFEMLRVNPLPSEMAPSYYNMAEDAGKCQLAYYEAVCDAAQMDLTEFFETWGFFRPIDQQYEQYGTVRYTVSETMINASRARVRDKGYPAAPAIQYLEDRTTHEGTTYSQMGYYTQYRDKVTITKTPKASISGRSVKLSDSEQAVAVEVRRGTTETGELLYFSNMFNFDVPSSVSLSGNTLWAVQYDGKRVKVQ